MSTPATHEELVAFVEPLGYTLEMFPDPHEPNATQLVIAGEGKASRQCGYLHGNERSQRAAFRCTMEAALEGLPACGL